MQKCSLSSSKLVVNIKVRVVQQLRELAKLVLHNHRQEHVRCFSFVYKNTSTHTSSNAAQRVAANHYTL